MKRLCLATTMIFTSLVVSKHVDAQRIPVVVPDVPTHVLLARLWVNEAGFRVSHWRDHAGITDVIRATGGGTVSNEAICRYSPSLCSQRRDRRRWVNFLREDGAEPEHWRTHLSWASHRRSWMTLMRRARGYVRWNPRPCLERRRPRHWGAQGFRREYWQSRGWVELTCPGAMNAFWARP